MKYLSDDELKKLSAATLLKEERDLLYLLKLFKLNKPEQYNKLISSLLAEEVSYIEDLIHKREGLDTTRNLDIDKINIIIKQKTIKFLQVIDPMLLKNCKILMWELE